MIFGYLGRLIFGGGSAAAGRATKGRLVTIGADRVALIKNNDRIVSVQSTNRVASAYKQQRLVLVKSDRVAKLPKTDRVVVVKD